MLNQPPWHCIFRKMYVITFSGLLSRFKHHKQNQTIERTSNTSATRNDYSKHWKSTLLCVIVGIMLQTSCMCYPKYYTICFSLVSAFLVITNTCTKLNEILLSLTMSCQRMVALNILYPDPKLSGC